MFRAFDLFTSLRRGYARRSSIRALQRLPAAQLRDIGVAPGQIDQVVDATLSGSDDRRISAASTWVAFLSSGSVPRPRPVRI